jgi:hypothetical protein
MRLLGPAGLLQVGLDLASRADLSLVRVEMGTAEGVTLAQQVPALVKLDLEVLQPLALLVCQVVATATQVVLLRNKSADGVVDLRFVHWHCPFFGSQGFLYSLRLR